MQDTLGKDGGRAPEERLGRQIVSTAVLPAQPAGREERGVHPLDIIPRRMRNAMDVVPIGQ